MECLSLFIASLTILANAELLNPLNTMKKILILSLSLALIGTACERRTRSEDHYDNDNSVRKDVSQREDRKERGDIRLTPVTDSPDFPQATLQMTAPKDAEQSGEIAFRYEVKNYRLGNQTPDADTKKCANSAQGQHIHFIIDNEPYIALYQPTHEAQLKEGNHLVLSFLSRSYHESLKHKNAYVLKALRVGKGGNEEKIDMKAPMLFYSRPKGEYTGEDTKRVLLDFYLVNTDLAKNGNRVRAVINGKEFMLDRWTAYMVEGLPIGESTIQLELVDKKGEVIPGPYNSVTRKITLSDLK